jgi:hypothetical protein
MGEIIHLNNYRQEWQAVELGCIYCGKEWVGVIFKNTIYVECPQCHKFTPTKDLKDA